MNTNEIMQVVSLKEGDSLVVIVDRVIMTQDEATSLKERISAELPNIRIVVMPRGMIAGFIHVAA